MDKKAFFTDPIIAVFSFVALVLIFIIFNLVFAGIVDEQEFDLKTFDLLQAICNFVLV